MIELSVGVYPAVRDQIQRPVPGNLIAEFDLDPVVARHALVAPAPEGIEITAVTRPHYFRHVIALGHRARVTGRGGVVA